uniref:RNA polymerase alpha subunit n=1 Tax=Euglena gracilis var. bacillaris TaxID=158060 RepID=A0A0G3VQY1_EUGGR|nr:RNA polymerase alpha subunit [Euglena gracilis var. bacillaris]
MKYLKIYVLRSRLLKDGNLAFFKVKNLQFFDKNFFVTEIRRITNVMFFVTNNLKNTSTFHVVHNFLGLEELKQSLLEITKKFKLLRFKLCSKSYQGNKFFAVLNAFEVKDFLSGDIIFPPHLKLLNSRELLFTKISFNITLKILLKITTDGSVTPFNAFIKALQSSNLVTLTNA